MENSRPGSLKDYPVVIKLPILWGDQDAFGHVNNVIYFRWSESARIAYLIDTGLQNLLTTANLGPILASLKCDFLRQLNFPDTVHIGSRITRLGNKSFSMEHAIYSEALADIVARLDSVIVIFDYAAQKSCPIPADVREKVAVLEGRTF